MKDMTELERRISAALDRIATHVDALHARAPEPDPVPAEDAAEALPPASELLADLEAERAVTAQLEERVRAIKEKQDTRIMSLESDLGAARDRVAALEEENEALRESAGVAGAEAELRAELERLHAERASERAELEALLAELKPIVEENAGA